MPDSFPWELRIEHEGFASLRLERRGRRLRIDPIPDEPWATLGETPLTQPITDEDVVLLSFCEHERLVATAHALRDGRRPTVIAPPEVLDWLQQFGEVRGAETPTTLDGVSVEAIPFEPIAYAEGTEIGWKLWSALSDPRRGAARLYNRLRLPRAKPRAYALTLPSGRRFVHLNLALHNDTPQGWLEEAAARFGGADWLLCGVDYGHERGFLDRVERLAPKRLLLADLVSDVRRSMGMPTTVLTPLADELSSRGVDVYVFASRSSLRFE